jgi:hypothetical protein
MWILCLDAESKEILDTMKLPEVITITPEDIGDKELLSVRPSRKANEFSWTSKPSLVSYVFSQINNNEIVAYIDADIYLFSSPAEYYKNFNNHSILITPHYFFPPQPEKEKHVGTYNAGLIHFKKDSTSIDCLAHWRKQCLEWCFDERNAGKLGDQTYLNDWKNLYGEAVLENSHKGINVGPWNLKRYTTTVKNGEVYLDSDPLVWYHFHPLKVYKNRSGKLSGLPVNMLRDEIYDPYVDALNDAVTAIRAHKASYEPIIESHPGILRLIKQKIVRKASW